MIEKAVVSDGRITFPKDTEEGKVKAHCGTCPLNLVCHGLDPKGFADIDRPRDVGYDEELDTYVKNNASCLNEVQI
jgi:hypothetical protein